MRNSPPPSRPCPREGWRRAVLLQSRGAALVELAVLTPVLLLLLAFSIHVSELVQVRLELQEVARFAAWEMTSATLTDFGSEAEDRAGTHRRAFQRAAREVKADLFRHYAALSTSGQGAPSTYLTLSLTPPKVQVNERMVWPASGESMQALSTAATAALAERTGFNPGGQVEVHASMALGEGSTLPATWRSYLLESRYTLLANGWHLPEGGDATVLPGRQRAGLHRTGTVHGLHRQTARMTFDGVDSLVDRVPGLQTLRGFLGREAFAPMGTYVVSHAYAGTASGEGFLDDRGCSRLRRHPAKQGLHNLATAPGIDHEYLSCFDTTPLRDTHDYDASLGLQQLSRRGAHFMGCRFPQADDPTAEKLHESDVHQSKQLCSDT